MKQSAAKTLGVAALGAAFAAAGAGAANAAPVAPDAAGSALDTVTRTLPAENLSQAAPAAGAGLAQGVRGWLRVRRRSAPVWPRPSLPPSRCWRRARPGCSAVCRCRPCPPRACP